MVTVFTPVMINTMVVETAIGYYISVMSPSSETKSSLLKFNLHCWRSRSPPEYSVQEVLELNWIGRVAEKATVIKKLLASAVGV